ncbi:MAG: SHOCT domain-containing protein [Methylococcales bacterium]|nr:SHOCT domain-containing protein [Methylococcales bacterium]
MKCQQNLAKIERESSSIPRIKATAGFFIPVDVINFAVTTPPVGEGHSAQYFPYKDLEAGYRKMLSNVFDNVVRLVSPNDSNEIAKNAVNFVFLPDLITHSGGSHIFPTNFTVDLTSNIRDATGKNINNLRVVGNGQAEYSGDGIAGKLAMEDALLKMQHSLLETKYNGIDSISATPILPTTLPSTSTSSQQTEDQTSSKLEKLKNIFDRGLITKNEYEQKRKEVLNSF